MKFSDTESQILRRRIKAELGYNPYGVYLCVESLARLAVDSASYSGFEDPRSAADTLLEHMRRNTEADGVACEVRNCAAIVSLDRNQDDVRMRGRCVTRQLCLKEDWDAIEAAPTVEASRAQHRSVIDLYGVNHGGSWCPRIDECYFSAGLSEDMIPGSVGTCAQQNREPQKELPITEVAVELS